MPVWAWCAVAFTVIVLVIIIAAAVSANQPAGTTNGQTPTAAVSQAGKFQITAVNEAGGTAAVDFVSMVDSYTPTTDVAALQQEGETIIAAWKQDNPMPSAAPYYITYSSADATTGMFVKRAIRTVAGTIFLMFLNSTATSKANVPVDNTGTWTYLYDGKGTARTITFAEVGSTGLLTTKHRNVRTHRRRG